MQALQLIQIVQQVQTRQAQTEYLTAAKQRCLYLEKARKRIPSHLKNTGPYSTFALWTYYTRSHHEPKGKTCIYCQMFDGQTFTGTQLRTVFPDHYFVGDDIYPNVHKTLWGVDSTCGCLLIREKDAEKQVNLSLWDDLTGTEWTEE